MRTLCFYVIILVLMPLVDDGETWRVGCLVGRVPWGTTAVQASTCIGRGPIKRWGEEK